MAGDLIKIRRATEEQWEEIDPVLALGEPGWDTTNNEVRLGTGVDPWTDLNPIAGGGSGGGGTAAGTTFSPTGSIAASNVQAALAEVDAEKAALIGATFAGAVSALTLSASGITGSTAASRYVGATTSGAPATGSFLIGDFVIDRAGALWICTAAGNPGTWVSVGSGGTFVTVTGDQDIAGVKTFTGAITVKTASANTNIWSRTVDLGLWNTSPTPNNYMTIGNSASDGFLTSGLAFETLNHSIPTGRLHLFTRTSASAFTSKLTLDDAVTVATGTPLRAPYVIESQSAATYTLVLADAAKVKEFSNASPVTVTVPLNSSVAFPVGTQIPIVQTGAGTVTVAGISGVTINTASSLTLSEQWAAGTLIKRATDTWLWIADEVGSGGGGTTLGLNTQTGTAYTLVLADADRVVELNNASPVTVTVPTNASVAFAVGTMIPLCQLGAGLVTISPAVGVTIRTSSSSTTRVQYAEASLRKRATNEWVLSGDLA